MFGGAKPTFGSTTTGTGFGGFNNTASSSPFGQSAFGKQTTTGFGTTSTFGTQPASLFGSNTGQQQPSNLFVGPNTSSAFGNTTTTQPAFGTFFSSTQPATNTTSLFNQPATNSTFGLTIKPGGFGQTSQSLFGQPVTSTVGFSSFGQPIATTTNVFGSTQNTAFGQPANNTTNLGSSLVKYHPTTGTDTVMKSGQPNNVITKQHCITTMKQYENKSIEEIRMEDYMANRRGPQVGTSGTTGFGLPSATGTSLFGATTQATTGLFGQPTTGTTENKGIFGSTISTFGQPTTTGFGTITNQQQTSFLAKPFASANTTSFGAVSTDANNPFGTKPAFGQVATPLFGQNTTATATAFGQPTTGFGTFGVSTMQPQQSSMFGQTTTDINKPTFGLGSASTANSTFTAFGNTASNTNAAGGLFGAKPATSFGTTSGFGNTPTTGTGFGNFSLNNMATGGGLFNSNMNKPATTGFGCFGTQTSTPAPLNFNTGSGSTSLFGNNANKPVGMFSTGLSTNTNITGGGLFSNTTPNAFGTNNNLTSAFGNSTLGGVNVGFGGLGGVAQSQHIPIHQQILSKVTSPYGDNPIFKDLKKNGDIDSSRATNPATQKAILESVVNTNQQFKISTKSSPSVVKVKPIGLASTKKSLFEGLEEFDASVENFNLKPNTKRLILKTRNTAKSVVTVNHDNNSNGDTNDSTGGDHQNVVDGPKCTQPINQILSKDLKNDSFTGEIPTNTDGIKNTEANALESSRRESWLHPNNLEKVRQHNLNVSIEANPMHNNTLNELVPRKPLETYKPTTTSSVPTMNAKINSSTNQIEEQLSTLAHRDYSGASNDATSTNINENASLLMTGEEDGGGETHPAGVVLRRIGYYTIPSLNDLKSYLADDGSCIVPNFTIGREGYGNVYFGREIDVAGLNLDEIIHFRNKEIIVYPDDDNKPPIGQGLNREAQVTLDQVWPLDKSKHEPIKNAQQLCDMDWEGRLRRVCDKNETRFIEYRPETGSWVFRVKHFSKYGLIDSDEEENSTIDAKKAKIESEKILKTAQNATENIKGNKDACSLDLKALGNNNFHPFDESLEFMLMDKTEYFQKIRNNGSMFDQLDKSSVVSPTAAMAKELGTDAYKLQLMKASFFNNEDLNYKPTFDVHNEDNIRMNTPSFGPHSKVSSDIYNSTQTLLWKEIGIASENSSQIDFALQSSSPALPLSSVPSINTDYDQEMNVKLPDNDINLCKSVSMLKSFNFKPKVAAVKCLAVEVPFVKSIAYPLRLKWVNDLGLYYSKSFKTCFGPQYSLIVPTTQNNINSEIKSTNCNLSDIGAFIFKERSVDDYSATVLQYIKFGSIQYYEKFNESIIGHLHIQLNNSEQRDVDGSDCPYIKSNNAAVLIMKHLEEATKLMDLGDMEEYAFSVWSLCIALWGQHEDLEGRDPKSHYVVMYRRSLFSDWLENTIVNKDIVSKNTSEHTYLNHLMELIMCHKITEACELAFSYCNANLALLLAQLSSGSVVRQLMEDQLAGWIADKADQFIEPERLKLFMLIAGIRLMSSSHGVLNPLEGIDWIKVMALQLWYFCSPTSSITDALLEYDKSFQTDEFYSQPPNPNYMEMNLYYTKRPIYDTRYHLLQLFSKRSYPLESVLNPATHTPDIMDYRLSWLLLQTLEALGYHHCSKFSEAQLHVSFAAQLENHDLWDWSIFILLHIKDRNQRELAVQNVLYRYVTVSNEVALNEKEKFVINNLGVPEKWIDYAKAVKARYLGDVHLQAKYLLKAKQWSLAHEIIFQYIAPDAIINDNHEYLHGFLNQFEMADMNRSNIKVPNWSNQGQIFLDFIDISEKFKGLKMLKTDADIETHWENLKPQLMDLCSRINLMPCPTSKHRLCQSEIAQNLACLIRGLLIVCPLLNPCDVMKTALERLPLPQEFAQQELRVLLDNLVCDLTKTYNSNSSHIENETMINSE